MIIEMISTGEEVLSGQITDTNASWISQKLGDFGIAMNRRLTVGDRMEDLIDAFLESSKRADVVIVNGGLGPTSDDLSSEAAARALKETRVLFPQWEQVLVEKFKSFNRTLTPENLQQAMLPKSAEILDNPIGTACGFVIKLNRALLYFTPGVPSEMKEMVSNQVIPHIRNTWKIDTNVMLKRLHCFGIAEARLGSMLDVIPMPPGVSLGFRAHLPTIEIKVMGHDENQGQLQKAVDEVAAQIRKIVGENIICEDDATIASTIGEHLLAKGETLSLAESCTGGMVTSQIIDTPGSSAYLDRSFITYTNTAKEEMIGVDHQLLCDHGAVSLEVVCAMAQGARNAAQTTYALAISGIAGPSGGTESKPVGTVCFALATPTQIYSQTLKFPSWGRTKVRLMASAMALDMLRRYLVGQNVYGNFDLSQITATLTADNTSQ